MEQVFPSELHLRILYMSDAETLPSLALVDRFHRKEAEILLYATILLPLNCHVFSSTRLCLETLSSSPAKAQLVKKFSFEELPPRLSDELDRRSIALLELALRNMVNLRDLRLHVIAQMQWNPIVDSKVNKVLRYATKTFGNR